MDVRLAFDGSLRSPISWAVYTEPNLLSVVSQQQCYDLRFWRKLAIFPWNQFHENFREDDFTENLCINIYVRPALILGYYMRRDRPSVHIGTYIVYIGAGFAIHSFVGLNGRHFWSRAKWSACLLKELSLRRSQVPILMTNSTSLLFRGRKIKLEFTSELLVFHVQKSIKKGNHVVHEGR